MPTPEAKTFAIALVTVNDPEEYAKYATGPHLEAWDKFDGRLVAIDEDVDVIEGQWPFTRTVIVEFPTKELARAWYHCDEYQSVIGFRHRSATSNVVIVSGFPASLGALLEG